MRTNPVKRALKSGGVAFGTGLFECATPGILQLFASAGAEYVFCDMEHSGFGLETIRELMATARGVGLVPFVRVPNAEYQYIARVLDVGAMGVIAPMIETREQAELMVRSTKYPPEGRRGCAFGVAHDDFTGGDIAAKMRSTNEESMVIVLIESELGLANLDGILSVAGVDVAWVGHFDLSLSMGIPGQFDHPTFQAALDQVVEGCRRHGVAPALMVDTVEGGREALRRGFRCVMYSGDAWLLARAVRDGIDGLRAAATELGAASG